MADWYGEPPPAPEDDPRRTALGPAPGLAGTAEYDPHGFGDPRIDARTLGAPGTGVVSRFDRLAVRLCVFGALVLIALSLLIVPEARDLYTPFKAGRRGFTAFVYSPGFALTGILLCLFLPWMGTRLRRLRRHTLAGPVLFVGIATAVAFNAVLVYALYGPASTTIEYLGR
ncbi:MAG: hypothetical protein AAF447_12620 [Myxococcota bacterium]